jgi:hypothetical protein
LMNGLRKCGVLYTVEFYSAIKKEWNHVGWR